VVRRSRLSGNALDDMVETAAQIDALFERELSRITQPDLVALIKRLRVPTRFEDRPWDYGTKGQTFPCWIVLEHAESDTAVAYCSSGFGPASPWGVLFLARQLSMGMDSQWFVSLEDAARESMAWDGENPPGYEVG
jgi:hypothetical protein